MGAECHNPDLAAIRRSFSGPNTGSRLREEALEDIQSGDPSGGRLLPKHEGLHKKALLERHSGQAPKR